MANGKQSLERHTFERLTRLYIIALSAIALSIVVSQLLVQRHLKSQIGDSRVINVAGRQRMLSQKLSKEALLLQNQSNQKYADELRSTLQLWKNSHVGLQEGNKALGLPGDNSQTIKKMFRKIAPAYEQIVQSTSQIIQLSEAKDTTTTTTQINQEIAQMLKFEPQFLETMDKIVFQYDKEARDKVSSLRSTELLLLFIALLILLIELFFIFRPTALQVRKTIGDLVSAESEAQGMTLKAEKLYKEKEQSLRELKTLNFAVDQAVLFASATLNGQVIYMSQKLCELLDLKKEEVQGNLVELLTIGEGEQQYLQELLQTARSSMWSGEVKITTRRLEEKWLEMSILPVNRKGVKQDLLIHCKDITARKKARQQIEQLKEDQFQEQIQQQKLRASQVIEAQEEERKRIARDIHDGIGQMLTALKFNITALQRSKPENAKPIINGINDLNAKLIKGIRTVTFNLTPPELKDYGIGPALSKLSEELTKLTGQEIIFNNRTSFKDRFDSIVETNLYRITQEAVNNAIKHADAEYIFVHLSHSKEILSIVIDDNGKGFEPKKVALGNSKNGSGMGLSFMQERVSFINGRVFVRSELSKGTRITLNMPMKGNNPI
ncbi:MAG: ATP-binding protein [Bacteroidota bacterium]